jgi:hypothetical protein
LGKLIELPKKHTLRKRLRDRAQDQKAAAILSVVGVLMLTVFVNQWFSNKDQHSSGGSDRTIASLSSTDVRQNIKWEHELALQLAVEKGLSQAALAEKPTLRDELVFGALQGRYGVKLKAGLVEGLEFLESRNGEEPLAVSETADFLMKYSSVWTKGFAEVRLRGVEDGGQEAFQLLDQQKTLVGEVKVKKDNKGRLISLEFINE